ncbi:SpoIIE family protein phosphatase [Xanthobacter autotrophicus]|uniref:PP2C family protein-serine/threonine phosphatase n=1 Tax=Xanthobacter TaxID=279 RepID=UPI0024AA8A85|nr:SpoIIE family protein phosphatase [Xanthobacter autotrophicus]MDI4664307.1 SpoIIE family protein phosphatase [Xanthobacter autotrophicus]
MPPLTLRQDDTHRLGPAEAAAAAAVMAQHGYFADFPFEALLALVSEGEKMVVPPGTRLIRRGVHETFALLVVEGTAVVTIDTPYAHVELARLAAPAVIGEIAAFTGVARTAHVDAATELVALRLSSEALEAAGRAYPALLSAVMRQFGSRFETFNRVFGFYANALNALERREFDLKLLDELRNPLPELVDFSHSFRRLAEAIMTRVAERREMANAAAIQRSMLPAPLAPDALAGRADIAAAMRPAKDVGGDFYDYFLIDQRHLVVSLGDVAGKGTPAALFMSATQTALRMGLRREADLSTAIATVNDLLCATNGEDMFVTLFCAVIDLETGDLTYCNCGHTDAMILRADGAIERPEATGMALAILEGMRPRAITGRLGPGDRLFLFSDGLTDAINTDEISFGDARLEAAALRALHLPADAFLAALLDAAAHHSGTAPQFDDMTALAVTFAPVG